MNVKTCSIGWYFTRSRILIAKPNLISFATNNNNFDLPLKNAKIFTTLCLNTDHFPNSAHARLLLAPNVYFLMYLAETLLIMSVLFLCTLVVIYLICALCYNKGFR